MLYRCPVFLNDNAFCYLLTFCCIHFIFVNRYKKRERGKLVNAYSEKDLQGILVNSSHPS